MITDKIFKRFLDDFQILCEIDPELSDPNQMSQQLKTILKSRHDFWVQALLAEINDQGEYTALLESSWNNLTPDLYLIKKNTSLGVNIVLEVSLTLNDAVLSQKRHKYTSLLNTDKETFELVDFTNDTEIKIGLVNCADWKLKFIDSTRRLIQGFMKHCINYGADSDFLKSIEELHYMGLFKQDFSIKYTRRLKPQKDFLFNDSRFLDPLDKQLDDIAQTVKKLLNDPDIVESFKLEAMTNDVYKVSYDECVSQINHKFVNLEKPKASFLFYSPLHLDINLFEGQKWKTEQDLLSLQISFLSGVDFPLKSLFTQFQTLLKDPETRNVFNKSVPYSTQNEPEMRSLYQNYTAQLIANHKSREKQPIKPMNFIDFCIVHTGNKPKEVSSKTRKTLTLTEPLLPETQEFILKSKTNMRKSEYIKGKLEKKALHQSGSYKIPSFDISKYSNEIEEYIDMLSAESPRSIPEEILRMLYKPGLDAPIFVELKDQALSDFKIFINCLRCTPMLTQMVDITRHLSQLLHFQNLTFKHNNFSMFNSGIPDVLYLIQHGMQDRGKDVGRSFLIIKFGDITEVERKLFGFERKYSCKSNKVIHITNWRRLNSQRIGFHIDQSYSILSTSFASFQRRLSESRTANLSVDTLFRETKQIFSMRLLVSMSHRQLFAEMLSDIRYLYMDAFSDFADCKQFIIDKYVKPVQTLFECFIIKLLPKFQAFRTKFLKSGVQFNKPVFEGKVRDDFSVGGIIDLPSILYKGVQIRSIQDLLDDMFLYVHTNKDPSNPYHEYVKAFKTIIKYQQKYEELSLKKRKGLLSTYDNIKDFLINDNGVGFWNLATHVSSKLIASRLSKENIGRKIREVVRDDTLLDMNSTKSIIPERERDASLCEYDEIVTSQLKTGNKHIRKKQEELWKLMKTDEFTPHTFTISTKKDNTNDKLLVLSGTNRCKVHDSTSDIINNTRLHTTLDLALWNINHNKSRVVTDICIKAQYGAKREFYVINHGAKAMARIVEQSFKVICNELEEEMISISGDKKMYGIQNLLDKALINSAGLDRKIYYCNGDCTKWSAAETMECLLTFVNGFESIIDPDLMELYGQVLMAWANKEIYVPTDLMKNVYFDIPGVTEKLKNPIFKSEQNFLQGMFNYLSSAKAVACSELTRHVWKLIFPDDCSEFYHMEHSDDYAFIFVTDDAAKFSKFKMVHRIIMRFLGISDSTKKTNCQQFLLEFISLLSFNGVMVYPHIKKIKEVGLNIGCLGYASDIMTTCSRVGEACRLGVSADIAYVMGRIQNVRIATAYGLFTSNKSLYYNNNMDTLGWTNMPVQLWGIPDVHPIFYLFSRGDANNYRLYKFDTNARKYLITLYNLSHCEKLVDEEEYQEDRVKLSTGLYHPNYNYLRNSNVLRKIRELLPFSLNDSQKYWEKHPMDLLLKPRDHMRFKPWLMSKYFQKSFGEAYMRQGRVQLVLRLSHFVKQKCLSLNLEKQKLYKYFDPLIVDSLDVNKYYSLSEAAETVFKLSQHVILDTTTDKLFLPTLYGFDQVAQHIYSHFAFSTIQLGGICYRNTKAYPEPTRKFEYTCVNDPLKVLQYIVSRTDFQKDNLKLSDVTVFLNDVKTITNLSNTLSINLSNIDIKEINVLAEVALSAKGGGKPLLLNFNPKNELLTSIVSYIEHQSVTNRFCRLSTGVYEEFTPKIRGTIFETSLYKTIHPLEPGWEMQTPDLLNDLSMLLATCSALQIPREKARDVLSNAKFQLDPNITGSKYIQTISKLYTMNHQKLTNQQVQIVITLSDFVNNDPLPLMKYLDTKLGYKYEYRKFYPKKHMTTVYLTILGESFILTFYETHGKEGHNLTITTDTKRLQVLPLVYLTGLRLMGSISINEYLKRSNQDMSTYLGHYPPIPNLDSGKQLFVNKFTGQFSFTQNEATDVIVPVIITNKIFVPTLVSGDDVHKLLYFDYDNISVFSGKAKVFTLPCRSLVQFNCWKSVATLKTYPASFLLNDNCMAKIFSNDHNIDCTSYFEQTCDLPYTEYKLKLETRDKFRITDENASNKKLKVFTDQINKQKCLTNPVKYGFMDNVYYENVAGMDPTTATDYMFGTTAVYEGETKRIENDDLDSVLDFDYELDEDVLLGGGLGGDDIRFMKYDDHTLDVAQSCYRKVRNFLRTQRTDPQTIYLLRNVSFLTTDKSIDCDVAELEYGGIGIDKVLLCEFCLKPNCEDTLNEFIDTCNNLPEQIEAEETISKESDTVHATHMEEAKESDKDDSDSFDFDDSDDFDIDVCESSDEEEKIPEPPKIIETKPISNEAQTTDIYDKEIATKAVFTINGIYDTPQEFLKFVESRKPINDIPQLCPGPTSALKLLRTIHNYDEKLALDVFPNYLEPDFIEDDVYYIDEGKVFHSYVALGLYNVSMDVKFKFHSNECDCKEYQTKYSRKRTLCNHLLSNGRSLLIAENFFTDYPNALEAFETILKSVGDEVFCDIFRPDLMPFNYTNEPSAVFHIIKSRFDNKPGLIDQLLDSDEERKSDYGSADEEESLGFRDILVSESTSLNQTHPNILTTEDIIHSQPNIDYTIKTPYNLQYIKTCLDSFPLNALEFKLFGLIKYKNLSNISKIQCLEIIAKTISRMPKLNFYKYFLNEFLKKHGNLLPNTMMTKINDTYYHSIRERKSVFFKKATLHIDTFQLSLPVISKIDCIQFSYNSDDTVDVFSPVNQNEIALALEANNQFLLHLLGTNCEIGQKILNTQKENEFVSFLNLIE